MSRIMTLLYGVACYAVFFGVFLYAIGFIGGFGTPTMLDGHPSLPVWQAVLIDTGLLGLFAIQHSVMARPAFKRWWTKFVPVAAERSTYVLFTSLALIAMFVAWQPIGGVVWATEGAVRVFVISLYLFGWALLLYCTFLIDHFDLFGLAQVWRAFKGEQYEPPKFKQPLLYRMVRHPLYVAWLTIFWAAPVMTAAHMLFAVMTTAYILIAIQLEERDLITAHPEYENYRRETPMLIPRFTKRRDHKTA